MLPSSESSASRSSNIKVVSQITKSYIVIMKKFEMWELQNVTQRYKGSKCYWKSGATRYAQCGVATNLLFKKCSICKMQ